jgi:hypothetical protein
VSLIQGLGLCVAGLAVCVIALACVVHSMDRELNQVLRKRVIELELETDINAYQRGAESIRERLFLLEGAHRREAAKWSKLSDISDEHQRAIDGFTNLQILHAANMSQVLSEVDKIRADRRWFGYRKDDN